MENITRTFAQGWRVETLRMTGFVAEVIKDPERFQLWSAITGESPENKIQNPRKAMLHEDGPFKNGKLILDIQPIRLDLLYTAQASDLAESKEMPTLGLFGEIIGDFEQLTNKLFSSEPFPPLQRIAFGSILTNAVKDRKEGYKKLADFLRFPIDAENSCDFFYQINRPRVIDLPTEKIDINRLSKWSVAGFEMLAVQIKPELRPLSSSSPLYATRLEVDISTTQHFTGSFNNEALPALFSQLIDFGLEISERGDIP
jgi:hypothetical protein